MPRILLLEDDPLIAMVMEDWLMEIGHSTVGPVGSVKEALALIEEGNVDAAVLDVTVQDGPSYAVAEALQARSIPLVFATGRGATTIPERFRKAPILAKPFDFEACRDVLAKLVGPAQEP